MANNPIEPGHYKGNIECIDAIASAVGREGVEDFCTGNIIKYIWRWRKKNGLEDLQKAQWYLNRLITYVQDDLRIIQEESKHDSTGTDKGTRKL